MLILGISGPLFSGRHTAAKFLIDTFNFTEISLENLQTPFPYRDGHKYYLVLITSESDFAILNKYTFSYLIWIEAPTSIRFRRYKRINKTATLDDFLDLDEKIDAMLQYQAKSVIMNTKALADLARSLNRLDLLSRDLNRPTPDEYFLRISEIAAKRTNCMKQAVGAVVVKNGRLMSTGYNGTPFGAKNCNAGGCKRCNSLASEGTRLDECCCLHGELSAILMASDTDGGTLYTTLFPCLNCTKNLIHTGFKRVVYSKEYSAKDSIRLLNAIGIRADQVKPYQEKIIYPI
ncbi:unnamed protein product [Blepharisma stoltei]|uniref:dCMP deaminase n=1 Tax=Blepharisma stoltei TaxID=1481888 RepID=A0AAU9JHH7_9CILI|nr:unnamed protein product [Blepharisma stoltei]